MLFSGYALYVEYRVHARQARLLSGDSSAEEEAPFVALCDLGSWASCSDVLTSESSHLFGPPNALLGFIFYVGVFLYPSVTFVPAREKLLLAVVAFSCVS